MILHPGQLLRCLVGQSCFVLSVCYGIILFLVVSFTHYNDFTFIWFSLLTLLTMYVACERIMLQHGW